MIAIVSAPTNLGLRPPERGSVPGTSKAPEAFREAGLYDLLGTVGEVIDGGAVLPGRYVDDDGRRQAGTLRNQVAVIDHALRLAARIEELLGSSLTPLVLGGDCSVLIGVCVAMARQGLPRLVHVDGHTDFRHPGNSSSCASLAGEDLAAVVGRHWPAIADIDGLGAYIDPARAVQVGCRDDDEELEEVRECIGDVIPASDVIRDGVADAVRRVRSVAGNGYWLQIDVDVLDPSYLPAVDSPDPGGLSPAQLSELVASLAPGAIGASITVFDPDLDPDGRYAELLVTTLVPALARLGDSVAPIVRSTVQRGPQ